MYDAWENQKSKMLIRKA